MTLHVYTWHTSADIDAPNKAMETNAARLIAKPVRRPMRRAKWTRTASDVAMVALFSLPWVHFLGGNILHLLILHETIPDSVLRTGWSAALMMGWLYVVTASTPLMFVIAVAFIIDSRRREHKGLISRPEGTKWGLGLLVLWFVAPIFYYFNVLRVGATTDQSSGMPASNRLTRTDP